MSGERPIILVDTNIWVDNYLPNRPLSQASRRFLHAAHDCGMQLAYPVHCIKDVFFLIQAGLKRLKRESGPLSEADAEAIREAGWGCVQNMREFACSVGADESDIWIACRHRALTRDLEDNLVIAAAQRAHARLLVTNDAYLLKHAPVPALSAADALVLIESGVLPVCAESPSKRRAETEARS